MIIKYEYKSFNKEIIESELNKITPVINYFKENDIKLKGIITLNGQIYGYELENKLELESKLKELLSDEKITIQVLHLNETLVHYRELLIMSDNILLYKIVFLNKKYIENREVDIIFKYESITLISNLLEIKLDNIFDMEKSGYILESFASQTEYITTPIIVKTIRSCLRRDICFRNYYGNKFIVYFDDLNMINEKMLELAEKIEEHNNKIFEKNKDNIENEKEYFDVNRGKINGN